MGVKSLPPPQGGFQELTTACCSGGKAPRGPSDMLVSTFLGMENGLSEANPSNYVVTALLSPRQDGVHPSPTLTFPELFP